MLFADADGATSMTELKRLEAAISKGAQVAIGSRALFSLETEVETVWYRKLLGRFFNAIVNVILLPGIADTQCGFKLFTRDAAMKIFGAQREARFAFDVEILYLARKLGCRITEVPVNWQNVPGIQGKCCQRLSCNVLGCAEDSLKRCIWRIFQSWKAGE